ncbi:MAG: GyrI-like domain-containing protein [Cyclobacteriaceae bacterium]
MHLSTKKEYHKSINLVLDYINAHLARTIKLESLASLSNLSKYHFHRIFKDQVGETLNTYVIRIRLERAAQLLQTFDLSLSEIAERTGYRTQQSLSKAFKRHFGIAPSEFRKMEIHLPPSQRNQLEKNVLLNPEICNVPTTHVVYIRVVAPYGTTPDYDAAWRELMEFGETKNILSDKTTYLGLSFDDPAITSGEKCRFYACITTEEKIKPEGVFGVLTIETGTYAVFKLKGSYEQLNGLYQSIYLDWLPQSGAKLRSGVPFEKYLNSPDQVPQANLLTEIYIPLHS